MKITYFFFKAFLSTATFLHRSMSGCAIVDDRSCSLMNNHTHFQVKTAASSQMLSGPIDLVCYHTVEQQQFEGRGLASLCFFFP